MLCKLLCSERVSLQSVKKYWGAGFEMVYLIRDGFRHFDGITYVINHAIFDNAGDIEIPIPEIIMHYRYAGDTLYITAINPLTGETEEKDNLIIIRYKKFNVRQFVVEPIYSTLQEADKQNIHPGLSFTDEIVAMGYVIETHNGDFMPASFNFSHEQVVEYKHNESLVITMQRELNDTVAQKAKEVFIGKQFKGAR
jgi:hypothetical protein